MAPREEHLINSKQVGDVAVDGLFSGLVAGIINGGILLVGGLLIGSNPVTTWGWFDPRVSSEPIAGGLLHLAISAVYGLIFALIFQGVIRIWKRASSLGWFIGLLYGLMLWLLAEGIFLSGLDSKLQEIPLWLFVIFHSVFGLSLGILIARTPQRSFTSS